jgi:TIR domain
MTDIFFSYDREDKHRVQLFCVELQKMGFKVAWDQKILGGQEWEDWIFQQLMAAKAVIVFWSHDSIQSDYVRQEAKLAHKAKKLIPVYIDRLSALEKARLMGFDGLQHIELINWKGDAEDAGWKALVEAIGRMITPAFVDRMMENVKSELHAERVKAQAIIIRETTLEKELSEAEHARQEAMARERKTGLDLVAATSRMTEVEERATRFETEAREVKDKLSEAEALASELKARLKEDTLKLAEREKQASKQAVAINRGSKRHLALTIGTSVAMGAVVSAIFLLGSPQKPLPAESSRALIACETLAGDNNQTPLTQDTVRARIAECKTALSRWFTEVAQSKRPIITSFGDETGGKNVSGWAADVGITWIAELSNSGLALVTDLTKLQGIARHNHALQARIRETEPILEQVSVTKVQNAKLRTLRTITTTGFAV